ncbi:phosphoribosylformylglycinamidine synthase subunit II [Terriglobus roseus DSM 18391]|uniref:Phosphoribosylformylglycinamidine synthase subunit PurL n=1 Tax=Terriglobus roseus (strain DSM 18391 / NRRL B-41598 / KBS 63) TaxID=926566 RepID=I3ZM00_TERRK|nr:phosphoribosylformylglycinamidine synthase subunit II [Terriglobus roseus DSM 18391]
MSQPTAIPKEAEVATSSAAISHDVPKPCTVTPALLKTHNITDEEYAKILATMGRTPSLTELGIYSVMWSEHCSYKSSRVHLKRLPTKGTRTSGPGAVMQGPGENAGIIDVGEGWACAFKIESHNHPSYIEPYQGAATGVGGILRDIFTMGARPMAVMDSLRFGPLGLTAAEGMPDLDDDTLAPESIDYEKNRSVMEGVVHGVAGYGNCFGVPNVGGETRFEACYSGNPLLNAFALGLVRHDEIFYAKATGVGNPVIYVGAKTGRDGIHGATMASEEFTEGSEQKRPNVQMGDPFLEKLLLEACLEAMKTGAVSGIQDMGAAGLTCSTCEMGGRGGVGLEIELDKVPQRDSGMTSYEIMLSESQERMLLVAHAGREQEILDVFDKWGLDSAVIGTVIPENRMKVRQGGELVADLSNESLTDDAPVYHRPVGTWKAPVSLDPPAWVLDELKKPRDYTADLKKLLASSNICDKRHIFEQYDSMVQTNTVQGPGSEAGVIRIKGTGADGKPERGLAMALAGNGRWCYLDPKLGAMHAVSEAARKVACTGATPVSATNCLNFGNPMKPEIMAQLSNAIDGISDACTALGTPITGGNVSLYNETKGEGIYPTPVIGIVGILDDASKAVPNAFQKVGDTVVFLSAFRGAGRQWQQDLGSSAYAQAVLGEMWGAPPVLDLNEEAALHKALIALADKRLLRSAADLSDGGCVTAFARGAFPKSLGVRVEMKVGKDRSMFIERLFSEIGSSVIATLDPAKMEEARAVIAGIPGVFLAPLGEVIADRVEIVLDGESVIDASTSELAAAWTGSLEEQLAAELVLA